MSQCVWCNKKSIFFSTEGSGLCSDCAAIIRRDVQTTGSLIRRIAQNLQAADTTTRVRQCSTIIEHASRLLRYEHKGIRTTTPPPSEIIAFYEKSRNRILIESRSEELGEALAVAEFALAPHKEITPVRDALERIAATKTLLADVTAPHHVIAFINQKGGVGKTTSTLNIGAAIAKQRRTVLLIDFDPQANLTDGLGSEPEKVERSVYDLLKGSANLDEVVIRKDGVSLLPSSLLLSRAERDFGLRENSNFMLKEALKNLRGYRYVLIDCPPSLGFLTLNALTAATGVCIPLQPEYFALKGIRKLLDAVEYVRRNGNEHLNVAGIIGTRYDARKRLHREVMEKIVGSLDDPVFYETVRESIALSEASSHGVSIFEYDPGCNGAEDYMRIAGEILKWGGAHSSRPVQTIDPVLSTASRSG